ncbi:MAG: hypothetical protein ABI142_09135, partial [Bryocella sp.]
MIIFIHYLPNNYRVTLERIGATELWFEADSQAFLRSKASGPIDAKCARRSLASTYENHSNAI